MSAVNKGPSSSLDRQAAEPALRNITLPCPRCGEEHAGIAVHLAFLAETDGSAHFSCDDCGEEFTIYQITSLVRKWSAVLSWLALAPELED